MDIALASGFLNKMESSSEERSVTAGEESVGSSIQLNTYINILFHSLKFLLQNCHLPDNMESS